MTISWEIHTLQPEEPIFIESHGDHRIAMSF